MTLLILTETSAGYALLKAKDKKLLKRDADKISAETQTAEGTCELLKLKKFVKFGSAATALEEAAALGESKVTPMLASLLDEVKDDTLAVADSKLAKAINSLPQFDFKLVSDSRTDEVYRAIRQHITSLIPGLLPSDINTMSLGLSHSLSRHKLRFSPDKVDTVVIQSIALLDDIDKQLNTYAMRVKEWYGWHFPEMGKIINDNVAYARVIIKAGMRTNIPSTDLSDILPEEIEAAIKAAADISMGTEIAQEDLENISELATQVVEFTEMRQTLASHLSSRMQAIAPNLTALVGELVGARLIAHAGSLVNLAKSAGSTIQILGAEKALFRALKTKHDTPKYGLLYHSSIVGQATGKNKGKIARMVASKAALGLRVDAFADWGVTSESSAIEPTEEEKAAVGNAGRIATERRLHALEGRPIRSSTSQIAPQGQTQPSKWSVKEASKYNKDADGLTGDEPAATVKDVVMDDVDGVDEDEEEDEPKLSKEERKAAKAAKKAEKAAKKQAKEEKKKAKEDKKKRKRGDDDEDNEKKKKKKSKSKD